MATSRDNARENLHRRVKPTHTALTNFPPPPPTLPTRHRDSSVTIDVPASTSDDDAYDHGTIASRHLFPGKPRLSSDTESQNSHVIIKHGHPTTSSSGTDSPAKSVAICGATCVMSAVLVLHNKYFLTAVFPHENALLFVQNVFTIAFVLLGKQFGWFHVQIAFEKGALFSGLVYTTSVMTGVWSVPHLSVAMFTTLKRCTVAVSWLIELNFDRKPSTRSEFPAIATMILATFLAGHFDSQYSVLGYVLALISCVAQGSAFELGRRVAASTNRCIFSVLLVNSCVAITIQTVALAYTQELAGLLRPWELPGVVLMNLTANAFGCIALNYLIFLNCVVNSPLVHVVAGNMKAIGVTVAGTLLTDKPLPFVGWLGILGNFTGAAWFSYLKFREKHLKRKVKDDHDDEHHRHSHYKEPRIPSRASTTVRGAVYEA